MMKVKHFTNLYVIPKPTNGKEAHNTAEDPVRLLRALAGSNGSVSDIDAPTQVTKQHFLAGRTGDVLESGTNDVKCQLEENILAIC